MNDDYKYGVPSGETDYLKSAAALLDKAAQKNEQNIGSNDTRIQIARQYTILGAIQRGVMPAEMAKQLLASVTGQVR